MASATFSTSLEAQQAAALLENYHFELGHHDARQWVSLWLEFYPPRWIREAAIEALYQGRYKSVSVRQILELWQRREQPIRHASHEFEAAVCREFENAKALPNEVTTLPHMQRRRSTASRSIKKTRRLPVDEVSFNLSALTTDASRDAHRDSKRAARTAFGRRAICKKRFIICPCRHG